MQTGQVLESLSVSGDTITLTPTASFHPGELVQATLTTGIENLGGEPLGDDPYVWQFRTAATGGTGLFSDSGQSLREDDTRAVALGDVDGDGDLDAFVGNWDGPDRVWLNDGSGTFSDSGLRLGDSDSPAVALGDVDGDGDLDAFVGKGGPNKVWLNDGNGTFADSGQSLGNSDSQAVSLGDVDGDGDLDAFVANVGAFGGFGPNKVWLNQDPLPGDFDNDQDGDGDDFLIWQAGFGIQTGATRYDGDVDGDDFLFWQAQFELGGSGQAAVTQDAPTSKRERAPTRIHDQTRSASSRSVMQVHLNDGEDGLRPIDVYFTLVGKRLW